MRTARELQEANEILGGFVGWKYHFPQGEEDLPCYKRMKTNSCCSSGGFCFETRDGLDYHENLNSLAEVIQKIESLGYDTSLQYSHEWEQHSFSIYPARGESVVIRTHKDSKIIPIFEAALDFVKVFHLNAVEA